jgi:hypothetical protein
MSVRTGRPLDERSQIWIESSLAWFRDQFGTRPLLADVAVPAPGFVPAGYAGTPGQVEQLVASACARMEIDREQVDVHVGAAADPVVVLADIAHELSRVRLIGARGRSARPTETERLTDLLTVFCGYGVFTARRPGSLTPEEFGYALSCYAWLRRERHPAWARFVSAGPLQVMHRGLEFLTTASPPGELPTQQRAADHSGATGAATVTVVKTRSATTTFGVAVGGITLSGPRPPGGPAGGPGR